MPDDESGAVDTMSDDDGEPGPGQFYTRVPRAGAPEIDPLASEDRGAGIPRLTSGHSWDQFRKHPPLACNNPKISASYRGYYSCPACASKVRVVGYRTGREIGYDIADAACSAVASGVAQTWRIGVDLLISIGRAVAWVWCKMVRKRSVKEDKSEQNQPPAEAVYAVMMLARVISANASSKGKPNADVGRYDKAPRPREAEEGAGEDAQKVEKAQAKG